MGVNWLFVGVKLIAPTQCFVTNEGNGIINAKPILLVAVAVSTLLASSALAASKPTYSTLAQRAQKEVKAGGVYGRGWGASSPKLKRIITAMIYHKFGRGYEGKRMWCYANRESGLNPYALSSTGDHSTFQFNYYAHKHSLDFARLDRPDVGYSIDAAWRMSAGGTKVNPWAGGSYSCPQGNEPHK